MKTRRIYRLAALLTALLMLAPAAMPAAADGDEWTVNENDAQKLAAFWEQPAFDGMNNGEAVYYAIRGHEWGELSDYGEGFDPYSMYYEGGWKTAVITPGASEGSFTFNYDFTKRYFGMMDGDVFYEGWESVFPDLYGEVDLSETALYRFGVRSDEEQGPHTTHITGVDLNGCAKLTWASVEDQAFCTSFEALNCPKLAVVKAENAGLEHIAFSTKDFDEPVIADVLGLGHIGASYSNGRVTLTPYSSGRFVGWYIDGELVVTDNIHGIFDCDHGVNAVAYFGGDADGNGVIDSTDALLLLRAALGVGGMELDLNTADVNDDGVIDTTDALQILRLALGIR